MTTPAINPHLVPTTYARIKPGDRVAKWPLQPTHPDAHRLARTVHEIVRTYRTTGFHDHGLTNRTHRFTHYDHTVIVWRDTNGSLFEDHADETVYINPA